MAKAKAKKKEAADISTEEKIKRAALTLFTKKGFSATRTRDISEEAGINLALLNYYFRSKEKLFELVMTEILQNFFKAITQIFNDKTTSIDEKVKIFVNSYIDLLTRQPDIPLFIFHELKLNPEKLATKMGVNEVFKSFFFQQLKQEIEAGKIKNIHPLHYVINMIGMSVFPFIAAPLMKHLSGIDSRNFDVLIDQRKTLVPEWMKSIMYS
jgi:AcrR family transcriptional regulator